MLIRELLIYRIIKKWLQTIISNTDKLHLAIVNRNHEDVILSVHTTLLDENKDLYVVTLTDVSQMHQARQSGRNCIVKMTA